MKYALVVAAMMVFAPEVAVSTSDTGCRGDCVGNGNARDGRECFNDSEVQTLDQIVPVLTGNGTSCPEQQPIVGVRVNPASGGCNRIDVFYCQTSIAGAADGFRLDREPRECFNPGEVADFRGMTHIIQQNGTACPADRPAIAGVKLQHRGECWRAPAVYCHAPQNLLAQGGFEELAPPALEPPGAPGWVSDSFRQLPAKSETNQPRSGTNNGACWATSAADCGIYQELAAPATGDYTFTIYATADRPGLVGVNVNGSPAASTSVAPRGFGNYGAAYTLTFFASRGDMIRVWMYSPATPGYVVIDDASLTMAF